MVGILSALRENHVRKYSWMSMNQADLIEQGRDFERQFFGKSLRWEYDRGKARGCMTFEQALADAIIIHRQGYRHYQRGGIRDRLHAAVRGLMPHHLDIYCAVNTVLDRDFGVDGFFVIRRYERTRVLTFDLVLSGHIHNISTQKAHLRIQPVDVTLERLPSLAAAVMRGLYSDMAFDATEIFAQLNGKGWVKPEKK